MKANRVSGGILGFLLCLCLIPAAGCGAGDTQSRQSGAGERPVAAVTIVPQQTFVKAVCGDLAEVITLVPPGYSPESYEPTARQMERLSGAHIYFSIGVPVEKAGILQSMGNARVVSLEDEAALVYPDRTFDSGERDPHLWLSPKRVKVMIGVIAREMAALDPENKDVYSQNAKAYIKKLDELDGEILAALEGVVNRKFIVFHPAFGYLADDYGLTMYALEEDGKEATPRHLQQMIDLAKSENIKVIFYQEEMDSSQSRAFAEEIGGKTMQLAPLAADYIENLRKMAKAIAEVMQ